MHACVVCVCVCICMYLCMNVCTQVYLEMVSDIAHTFVCMCTSVWVDGRADVSFISMRMHAHAVKDISMCMLML